MLNPPNNVISMQKAWLLLCFCATLFVLQSVATALSHSMLSENEKATVKEILIDDYKDRENLNLAADFPEIARLCARDKWAMSRRSNELGSMKTGEPPDLDTLPLELSAHEKDAGKDETPRLDDLVFLDSIRDLQSLGARHSFRSILQTIRRIREELISLVGEHGVKTLDAEFAAPARTIAFIKYGRDGNSLSADDVMFLKRVLKQDRTIDSEEKASNALDVLSNYFYNYRTIEAVEAAATNLKHTHSSKELGIDEFVTLNLLLDRKYFVSHYGNEALNQIDDFLGVPSALRKTLAKSPELYFRQQDLLTNQDAFESVVSDIQEVALTERPEI